MYIHMTTGTENFLLPLMKKLNNEKITLMKNSQNALLLHETENKKSKFQQPKSYQVSHSSGDLFDSKFIAIQYIPLTDEGKPVFEFNYQQFSANFTNTKGFYATRVLAPLKGNTYVIITAWESESSFRNWEKSDPIAKKIHDEQNSKKELLADPAYTSFYYIQSTDK